MSICFLEICFLLLVLKAYGSPVAWPQGNTFVFLLVNPLTSFNLNLPCLLCLARLVLFRLRSPPCI
jgi:hypothetical protein